MTVQNPDGQSSTRPVYFHYAPHAAVDVASKLLFLRLARTDALKDHPAFQLCDEC